jgi:hypothetical protein
MEVLRRCVNLPETAQALVRLRQKNILSLARGLLHPHERGAGNTAERMEYTFRPDVSRLKVAGSTRFRPTDRTNQIIVPWRAQS